MTNREEGKRETKKNKEKDTLSKISIHFDQTSLFFCYFLLGKKKKGKDRQKREERERERPGLPYKIHCFDLNLSATEIAFVLHSLFYL